MTGRSTTFDNYSTQEFTLRWSQAGGPFREIVRQQWHFSPHGSTIEVEDYQIDLERASVLELTLSLISSQTKLSQLWPRGAWHKRQAASACNVANFKT
jgi:hypothetical protein